MEYLDDSLYLNNCDSQLNKIADSLQKSIKDVQILINEQKDWYFIDDINVGENYLNSLIEKQQAIFNNIVNNVLPVTYNTINDSKVLIPDNYQEKFREKDVINDGSA